MRFATCRPSPRLQTLPNWGMSRRLRLPAVPVHTKLLFSYTGSLPPEHASTSDWWLLTRSSQDARFFSDSIGPANDGFPPAATMFTASLPLSSRDSSVPKTKDSRSQSTRTCPKHPARHPRRPRTLRGLGPQDRHAMASRPLLSKHPKKGPPKVSPPGVRAPAWTYRYLGLAEQFRRELECPSQRRPVESDCAPHNAKRRYYQQPLPPSPPGTSPSLTRDTADPLEYFHFFCTS